MDKKQDRRQIIRAYKESDQIGGIFQIVNTKTGWKSGLQSTVNLQGQKNRLQFAKETNCCFDRLIEEQWKQYGGDAFVFQEIETLKKKPDQTGKEFGADLAELLALWKEKEE